MLEVFVSRVFSRTFPANICENICSYRVTVTSNNTYYNRKTKRKKNTKTFMYSRVFNKITLTVKSYTLLALQHWKVLLKVKVKVFVPL